MSKFKSRLNNLFSNEFSQAPQSNNFSYRASGNGLQSSYQTDFQNQTQRNQNNTILKATFTPKKNISFNQSVLNSSTLRMKTQSTLNVYSTPYTQRTLNTDRSNFEDDAIIKKTNANLLGFQKRKISSQVLDKSAISPFYIEKPSFYNSISTENKTEYFFEMRAKSSSKYNSRIKKEIDILSKSFREGIIPTNQTINRPMTTFPKNENFSINLLTTPKFILQKNGKKNTSINKYMNPRFNRGNVVDNSYGKNDNKCGLAIGDMQNIFDDFKKKRNKY